MPIRANHDHQCDLHNIDPKCVVALLLWFTIFHDQGMTRRALGPLFMPLLLFDASSSCLFASLTIIALLAFLFFHLGLQTETSRTGSCKAEVWALITIISTAERWSTLHLFCLCIHFTKCRFDFVKSVLALGCWGNICGLCWVNISVNVLRDWDWGKADF